MTTPPKADSPKNPQVTAAHAYIGDLLQKLAAFQPKLYVEELVKADTNHDGTISSDELAASFTKGNGLFSTIIPIQALPMYCGISMAPAMADTVKSIEQTLDVLNHPENMDALSSKAAEIRLRNFASDNRLEIATLDPDAAEIIKTGVTEAFKKHYQALLDANRILHHDNPEIGTLPTQMFQTTPQTLRETRHAICQIIR